MAFLTPFRIDRFDVYETVHILRKQRSGMVQTPEQYGFIHQVRVANPLYFAITRCTLYTLSCLYFLYSLCTCTVCTVCTFRTLCATCSHLHYLRSVFSYSSGLKVPSSPHVFFLLPLKQPLPLTNPAFVTLSSHPRAPFLCLLFNRRWLTTCRAENNGPGLCQGSFMTK